MTLAAVAAARGELDELSCGRCDEQRKHERGCGRPPTLPDWGEDDRTWQGYKLWNPEEWRARAIRKGVEPTGEDASSFYSLANVGDAVELLGQPWPCCPRYFEAFAPVDAQIAVSHVFRLDAWRQSGGLEAVTELPLLHWQVDLLDLIERARQLRQRKQIEDMTSGG